MSQKEVKGFETGTVAWNVTLFYIKMSPQQQKVLQDLLPSTCVCNCRRRFGIHVWVKPGELKKVVEFLAASAIVDYAVRWNRIDSNEGRPNGPWLVGEYLNQSEAPVADLDGLGLDKDQRHIVN